VHRRVLSIVALIIGTSAPVAAQTGGELYAHLSDSVVHLPGGDSVELQARGAAVVPNQPPGVLITYHPFFALSDTVRVRAAAVALFHLLLPTIKTSPHFVVFRAVDIPAAERNKVGAYHMSAYGIVFALHDDGRWYDLHGTSPAF
jgi:hypothetical protein